MLLISCYTNINLCATYVDIVFMAVHDLLLSFFLDGRIVCMCILYSVACKVA